MPNQARKKNQNGRKRSAFLTAGTQNNAINPGQNQLVYSGPTRLPQILSGTRCETFELHSTVTFTSDGSGVIAEVINNNPSGYIEWSSLAGLWDEYRPLSLTVQYHPTNRYSKSATVTKPYFQVIDRDSAGVIASVAGAAQYGSCKLISLEDPWSETIRMSSIRDATFITTASPIATFYLKGYQSGFSNSTEYGQALITLLVQVRGRN